MADFSTFGLAVLRQGVNISFPYVVTGTKSLLSTMTAIQSTLTAVYQQLPEFQAWHAVVPVFIPVMVGFVMWTIAFFAKVRPFLPRWNCCRRRPALGQPHPVSRFSTRRPPASNEADVIVVGGGAAGLMSAALLSVSGRKVFVFDQGESVGGGLHTFKGDGVEFDTGLHYLGKYTKLYSHWFRALFGEADAPTFVPASDSVYDRLVIPGQPDFDYRPHTLESDLISRFPKHKQAIKQYLAACRACAASGKSWFLGRLLPIPRWLLLRWTAAYRSYASLTVDDQLALLGISRRDTPELYAVLLGQSGNYGLRGDKASFFTHAAMVLHFEDGGYYPVGGPSELVSSLVTCIQRGGGEVFTRSPIRSITTVDTTAWSCIEKQKRVTGVNCRGVSVRAREGVISTIGQAATLCLMNTPFRWNGKRVLPWDKGTGHLSAFVTLRGSPRDLKLPAHNTWVQPAKSWGSPAFISFPSAKDPVRILNERSSCIVVTEVPANEYRWYEGSGLSGARRLVDDAEMAEEYALSKKHVAESVKAVLSQTFPGLEDSILDINIGTPLSTNTYLGRRSSYGLPGDVPRCTDEKLIPTDHRFLDLYLAGQDLATSGIAGGFLSALLAVISFLGISGLAWAFWTRPAFWKTILLGRPYTHRIPQQ